MPSPLSPGFATAANAWALSVQNPIIWTWGIEEETCPPLFYENSPLMGYSWKAFMLASIFTRPWSTLMSVHILFSWYHQIGFYHNAEPTKTVIKYSSS
ncbi:hypothetical protein N7453_001530, partial [Penicillium expansum]